MSVAETTDTYLHLETLIIGLGKKTLTFFALEISWKLIKKSKYEIKSRKWSKYLMMRSEEEEEEEEEDEEQSNFAPSDL